ncbi:DegT/DnrJ/EryC1/StrS family aminotransferase [Pseudarthrobacter sp. CC12]|uniref:DegT/DnrJ/EryC1/StrS family aminotransferase n=1 Tax=Pseudarthrobacter sp. CC12 TaxID=3029193 RepID=UPI003266FF51
MATEAVVARIDVVKPWLGQEEVDALADVVHSGYLNQGRKVREFEAAFAAAQGARFAVATSSCTTALHLALVVAGIGPGDDVVVPSLAAVGTANAVTYVGARPVFCDVDPATGNVTVETIYAALTLDTRAVIVVDQAGVPVDLDPIRELCNRHEITLIEDAACAIGSLYRGKPVGAGSDIAVWSFHPDHILTTGEGGMLTTRRADWAARARSLRTHGSNLAPEDTDQPLRSREVCLEVGFDYQMTDLQAAIGLCQLMRLPAMVERRRRIAGIYTGALSGLEGLRFVSDPPYGTTNFQALWVEVLPAFPATRESLVERLADAGVTARRGAYAAHRQPAYRWRDIGNIRLNYSERLSDRTLVLPVFHELDATSINRVINAIRNIASPVVI